MQEEREWEGKNHSGRYELVSLTSISFKDPPPRIFYHLLML